jgi:methyl-accepting chemotaxis protein
MNETGSSPHTSARRGALARLGIRGRLIGMVVILGALAVACVGVAVIGLTSARSKSNNSQSTFNVFRTERDAYEGWLTDDDQGNMLSSLSAVNDRSQLALMHTTAGQITTGYQQALTNLQALIKNAPTAQLRSQAQKTLADVHAYNAFTVQVVAASLAFHAKQAVELMAVKNVHISNQTQADFDQMGSEITARAAAINKAVGTTVSSAISQVLIIALIGVLIAIAITVLMLRSIIRPLNGVTKAAERIAEGDINVEVEVKSDDEIGRMARAFRNSVDYLQRMAGAAREIAKGNLAVEVTPQSERDALGNAFADMRTTIAGMLGEISASSQTVGVASEQMARSGEQAGMAVAEISDAVSNVAQGAETQVRALGEARQLTAEVTSGTRASAQDAEETAAAVRDTRDLAKEGAAAVVRATDAMQAVQASSSEISDTIRELGSMSDKIGGIVDTITAIAEQTNLLALNAAIEAARAGEQGRGFAVVAEEVRKLAEESQTAAASISSLIAQIQTGTSRAVEVVTDGAQRAEQGAATVEEAREVFERIDAGVQNMSDRVERITTAVAQIAVAGGRVQESIEQVLTVAEQSSASAEQVSATTQETSASTQQIAASASELNKTAEQLQQLVNQFELPADA